MNITIHGRNLEITDNIKDFVLNKLSDSFRALGLKRDEAVSVVVELEQTSHRYLNEKEKAKLFKASVNMKMPGPNIHVEESASDIKQAVVKLKQKLTRELRHRSEKITISKRKGGRKLKNMLRKGQPL